MFQVEFTVAAQNDLACLDKPVAQRVLKKLRFRLVCLLRLRLNSIFGQAYLCDTNGTITLKFVNGYIKGVL
jgi:hypothetical protein